MAQIRQRMSGRRPVHPWDAAFDHSRQPVPGGLVAGAPDFVGIGAQKAGTSWWFDQLVTHPDIYHHPGYGKERHFLAKRGMPNSPEPAALAADYASWFPRPIGATTGEWTPAYLYFFWVAQLLARLAPKARILVLLRDPVERYLSALEHGLSGGDAKTAAQTQQAFERGFYASQLVRWEDLFDDSQLLVLQYERCCSDPVAEMARTYRHLGVDDSFVPPGLGAGHTPTPKQALSETRRNLLVKSYEADVSNLLVRHPEIDVRLWPNFVHLSTTTEA